jgi:hypothetical protein
LELEKLGIARVGSNRACLSPRRGFQFLAFPHGLRHGLHSYAAFAATSGYCAFTLVKLSKNAHYQIENVI